MGMHRVKNLMLNNNRIVRMGADLEPLSSSTKLEFLSLLHNPVVTRRNYREYVIHKFPNLRVLDFKKIKQKERDAAKSLYKSKEGKTQLKDIQRKAKTFVPGEPLPEATNKNTNAAGLSPDQVRQLKMMIAKAGSLQEMERPQQMLKAGQMPGMETQNGAEEMEQ